MEEKHKHEHVRPHWPSRREIAEIGPLVSVLHHIDAVKTVKKHCKRHAAFVLLSCSYLTPNDLISKRGRGHNMGRTHVAHPPSSYSLLISGPCSAGPSPCIMSLCNMINQSMISIAGVGVYLWYSESAIFGPWLPHSFEAIHLVPQPI